MRGGEAERRECTHGGLLATYGSPPIFSAPLSNVKSSLGAPTLPCAPGSARCPFPPISRAPRLVLLAPLGAHCARATPALPPWWLF